MSWHSCFHKHLSMIVLPALLLVSNAAMQGAAVTVMTSVSPQGANFLWDFAITDTSSTNPLFNMISVDFALPVGSVVGMATAPAGNGAVTDPSGNFVEFSSNNLSGFPVGSTVDGFHFVTTKQLSPFAFTANFLDSTGNILTGVNGTTTSQAPAVPEPSTLGLVAGAGLLLVSRFRKLRRAY